MEDPGINVVSVTVGRVGCEMLQSKYASIWVNDDSIEIYSRDTTKTTAIIAEENRHP